MFILIYNMNNDKIWVKYPISLSLIDATSVVFRLATRLCQRLSSKRSWSDEGRPGSATRCPRFARRTTPDARPTTDREGAPASQAIPTSTRCEGSCTRPNQALGSPEANCAALLFLVYMNRFTVLTNMTTNFIWLLK